MKSKKAESVKEKIDKLIEVVSATLGKYRYPELVPVMMSLIKDKPDNEVLSTLNSFVERINNEWFLTDSTVDYLEEIEEEKDKIQKTKMVAEAKAKIEITNELKKRAYGDALKEAREEVSSGMISGFKVKAKKSVRMQLMILRFAVGLLVIAVGFLSVYSKSLTNDLAEFTPRLTPFKLSQKPFSVEGIEVYDISNSANGDWKKSDVYVYAEHPFSGERVVLILTCSEKGVVSGFRDNLLSGALIALSNFDKAVKGRVVEWAGYDYQEYYLDSISDIAVVRERGNALEEAWRVDVEQ